MKTISIAKKKERSWPRTQQQYNILWTLIGLVHEKAHPEILQLTWIHEAYMEIVSFIFVIFGSCFVLAADYVFSHRQSCRSRL